jgi:hypothetical protein
MKKVLLLALALTIGGKYVIAQDGGENDIKNFRFGLKAAGQLTWYKPDQKKLYTSDGVSAKGSYGLTMEFRLNKVASINTGFQVDYFGGKLTFVDNAYYILSKDGSFLEEGDSATTGASRYKLNSRVYHGTYVTLPFTLKLKTPEIGSLTYFGMFGINNSVRVKTRVNDDVNLMTNYNTVGAHSTQTDLINTNDMNLFMFALNIGGGAEWNLAGTTSLVFGLNWYNGFSNVLKSDSKYLFRDQANNFETTKQNAKCSAFALSFGVLF